MMMHAHRDRSGQYRRCTAPQDATSRLPPIARVAASPTTPFPARTQHRSFVLFIDDDLILEARVSGCMLHALGMRGAGSSFAHRSRSATDPTSGPINNIANGGAGEKSFRNGSHCRGQAGAATSFTSPRSKPLAPSAPTRSHTAVYAPSRIRSSMCRGTNARIVRSVDIP